MIGADEISQIIKQRIKQVEFEAKFDEIGVITYVGDYIVRAYGLTQAMAGEVVETQSGQKGIVLNLEEESVGIAIMGTIENVKEGDVVRRTGKLFEVPVGKAVLGRVINSIGEPIDGLGDIKYEETRRVEVKAPGVIMRQPVREPLQTGIKSIDAMIPIGRGQRELIIGDRQTGKTTIAIDTIINQKYASPPVYCIYVAIGQKLQSIAQIAHTLKEHGAMDYTTIVVASASEPPTLQYIAPYVGCTIGEYFRDNGMHALIIYDDLTKHAQAYRALALLLRRPPGREAYPGDVFYLHSRLLERAAKLSDKYGGGSLTALPIVETQAGDVSAYIPTNVISITDGQIYLEPELFYAGVRPAINVGISVSRVGGNAQIKAMKKIAGMLRLELAQYRELETFAQFGSDLDPATLKQIERGRRLTEILKQEPRKVLPVEKQIVIIYAGTRGYLDKYPVSLCRKYEEELYKFLDSKYSGLLKKIEEEKDLTLEIEEELKKALSEFDEFFSSYAKAA